MIYLFDEPTSFLDIKNQIDIMKIARKLVEDEKKIVIMVVHDLNMAMRFSDKVLLMKDGKLVACGAPKEVLTPGHIKSVYDVNVDLIEDRYIIPR